MTGDPGPPQGRADSWGRRGRLLGAHVSQPVVESHLGKLGQNVLLSSPFQAMGWGTCLVPGTCENVHSGETGAKTELAPSYLVWVWPGRR